MLNLFFNILQKKNLPKNKKNQKKSIYRFDVNILLQESSKKMSERAKWNIFTTELCCWCRIFFSLFLILPLLFIFYFYTSRRVCVSIPPLVLHFQEIVMIFILTFFQMYFARPLMSSSRHLKSSNSLGFTKLFFGFFKDYTNIPSFFTAPKNRFSIFSLSVRVCE